jgi:hypothetical protein
MKSNIKNSAATVHQRLLNKAKEAARICARSLICHWPIRSLGLTAVAVSKLLGISQPAVARAAYRGVAIIAAHSLEPVVKHDA